MDRNIFFFCRDLYFFLKVKKIFCIFLGHFCKKTFVHEKKNNLKLNDLSMFRFYFNECFGATYKFSTDLMMHNYFELFVKYCFCSNWNDFSNLQKWLKFNNSSKPKVNYFNKFISIFIYFNWIVNCLNQKAFLFS